ncbi:hypothetical protein WJM97_10615 [Okeanomitos corallinicola TIOX110]|uniref:Uncharacterized protein n=1 Tax=Okeanomitos corallinicola TIOX110 TaxID=3133117 RepID=A0ABZ2V0L7_9CYAN
MKYKVLEDSSKHLTIQISNKREQILFTSVTIAGIFIIVFTYLGVIPSMLALVNKAPKESFLAPSYILGGFILAYGIVNFLFFFSGVIICSFDKSLQKFTIQKKRFFHTSIDDYPLSEVTGIEELGIKSATELIVWLRKSNQIRGIKIFIARASGYGEFHILWRKVSEFLREQPTQLLNRQWIIEQSEDIYKVYKTLDMYKNSDMISYTIDKRKGLLIYELDGKEVDEYEIAGIKDIQVEDNQDQNDDEMSDRIVLEMKNGEKRPISIYCYSSTSGAHLVVRSLKYAIGLQAWLHLSPDIQKDWEHLN